jgi:hypothetical protein
MRPRRMRTIFSSEALDAAYVPFSGAFGVAWDDAIVARFERQSPRDALAGDGRRIRDRWRNRRPASCGVAAVVVIAGS